MPCLLGCLAYFFPRLVIILVWIFSSYLNRAYTTFIWPLLGFIFMPLTTLAYAWAMNTNGNVTGIYAFVVVIAVICDLGTHGIGPMAKKVQQQRQ